MIDPNSPKIIHSIINGIFIVILLAPTKRIILISLFLAEIVNLIEYPDYLNDTNAAKQIYPVEIKHNNIIGKVLAPGEETELNVAATFNYKELPKVVTAPYQITILTKSPEK